MLTLNLNLRCIYTGDVKSKYFALEIMEEMFINECYAVYSTHLSCHCQRSSVVTSVEFMLTHYFSLNFIFTIPHLQAALYSL